MGSTKQQEAKPPAKAFVGGDQGFLDLKLESVENVSHNTKKFRFLLPEADQVSGLKIACGATPSPAIGSSRLT